MNNFLVLNETTYHSLLQNQRKIDEHYGPTRSTVSILKTGMALVLDVIAVTGDSCVEFLKNRYTGDRIMSLEEFEIFKQKYLK